MGKKNHKNPKPKEDSDLVVEKSHAQVTLSSEEEAIPGETNSHDGSVREMSDEEKKAHAEAKAKAGAEAKVSESDDLKKHPKFDKFHKGEN